MDSSSNASCDSDERLHLPYVVLNVCMSGLYLVAFSLWAVSKNLS